MDLKKIHILINPAAGNDEPILSYINSGFQNSCIEWEVSVTKAEGDAAKLATSLIGKVDAIVVYGGDGSIAEVTRALNGFDTPMAIIPGGTANVLSKELGIPQDPKEAIALIADNKFRLVKIDAAVANNELFLIRVNLGIMAEMVLEASRELKDKVGQLAYGISAIKTLIKSDINHYQLFIDGLEINRDGVALTVTNCGSIGIGSYSFLPDIAIDDGMLNVILMYRADLLSVLRVTGTTIMQTNSDILEHWKCKEIEIRFDKDQTYVLDDTERTARSIHIKILPSALTMIVPAK